jgi:hypothetical protein
MREEHYINQIQQSLHAIECGMSSFITFEDVHNELARLIEDAVEQRNLRLLRYVNNQLALMLDDMRGDV